MSALFTDRSPVENRILRNKLSVGEILPQHCWSITCVLDILRTPKGLYGWKTAGWTISQRGLWSQQHFTLQQEGTEKMWGLLWDCGSLSFHSKQKDHYKLMLPSPSAKCIALILPPHAYTCTCTYLCVNKTKMLITRRLCSAYWENRLSAWQLWVMAFEVLLEHACFLQQGARYKRRKMSTSYFATEMTFNFVFYVMK